ncbi:hypothetical protein [Paucidesulfovibrio longus]|uniref:hypothetical protein n=1 Tax=Paucidesulfovibrio longus TaxID=889 RepID=UPI0003B52169|nr:hypothetical protein [Paucidesulfovibrio longus]
MKVQGGKTDLVLGAAAGYHLGDVRPFLVSLARSGFQGECVLFVSPTTRDQERMPALASGFALRLVPMRALPGLEHLPCNALRHFHALNLLRREAGRFSRVLLTDVRDVIFQRDPFAYAWPSGLNAVLEHRAALLGDCPHNSLWVRGHLGPQALDALRRAPVSCSGTTLGDPEAVADYLEKLTALLAPYVPAPRMAGYDQAVHNHLVHGRSLPKLTLHDNSGPILTLASRPGEPALDDQGDVLNDAGAPALIVHQYDRKPGLFRHLREKYA